MRDHEDSACATRLCGAVRCGHSRPRARAPYFPSWHGHHKSRRRLCPSPIGFGSGACATGGGYVMASAFELDDRPLVAFDWSTTGIHVTFSGRKVTPYGSIRDLVASLTTPHKLLAECTYESWEPARRASILAELRAAGHELYVFRPLNTSRHRLELGWEKSDEVDARVIYRIGSKNLRHAYPAPSPDPVWADKAAAHNADYQQLRLQKRKPELTQAAMAVLGPYRELPEDAQAALGNGKVYSATLLAVLWFCAGTCRGRDEFERLIGFQGSGYPCLLRSEVMQHWYRHAINRGVDKQVLRREVRHAYQALRAVRRVEGDLGSAS